MKKPALIRLAFLFLCLMMVSCEDSKIVSDKDKFASLYIELQLSLENNRGDLNKVVSERNRIFRKFNVTQDQYNRTLEYFGMDKDKWDEFFNIVTAKLDKMKKKIY